MNTGVAASSCPSPEPASCEAAATCEAAASVAVPASSTAAADDAPSCCAGAGAAGDTAARAAATGNAARATSSPRSSSNAARAACRSQSRLRDMTYQTSCQRCRSSRKSANEGIGVPSSPVVKVWYTPLGLLSPTNCVASLKSLGSIGRPASSSRSGADGPSPLPRGPWHSSHCMRAYTSLPAASMSWSGRGGSAISTGSSWYSASSSQRDDSVLM